MRLPHHHLDDLLFVGGCHHPALRRAAGREISLQPIAMFLRPFTLREVAGGLIGTDKVSNGAEADEAFVFGNNRTWWAEHRSGVFFMLPHGDEPLRRRAEWLNFVVAPRLQS